MKDAFIDTDVIIDYITDRKPFSDQAEMIFAMIEKKKIKGLLVCGYRQLN